MLLASGIFRDVFLYNLEDIFVWDYSIKTQNHCVHIDVTLEGNDFSQTELIAEMDGQRIVANANHENSFLFTIDSPVLWNAEEPFTYKLVLKLTRIR